MLLNKLLKNKFSLIKNLLLFTASGLLITSCGSNIESNPLLDQQLGFQNVQPEIVSSSKNKSNKIEHGIFQGVVTKLLPDDLDGLKHQKFMFKVTSSRFSNEIIEVAHDVNYAPYVPVKIGSNVEIKGDLIASESPKVLHWTHHCEIRGGVKSHPDGFIKLDGKVYQ